MKEKIRLYVTTRSDPVPDLDDMKTVAELTRWKGDVRRHALKVKEYPAVSDALIMDLQGYAVNECYAVIAYPPGSIHEADDLVGEELLKFLKKNSSRINWQLEETGQSSVSVSEHAGKTFADVYESVSGRRDKPSLTETMPKLDHTHLWDNFTYGLIADKALGKDEYEVDLEVVVARN